MEKKNTFRVFSTYVRGKQKLVRWGGVVCMGIGKKYGKMQVQVQDDRYNRYGYGARNRVAMPILQTVTDKTQYVGLDEEIKLADRVSMDFDSDILPLYPHVIYSLRCYGNALMITKGGYEIYKEVDEENFNKIIGGNVGQIEQIEVALPHFVFLRVDNSIFCIRVNETLKTSELHSKVIGQTSVWISARNGEFAALAKDGNSVIVRKLNPETAEVVKKQEFKLNDFKWESDFRKVDWQGGWTIFGGPHTIFSIGNNDTMLFLTKLKTNEIVLVTFSIDYKELKLVFKKVIVVTTMAPPKQVAKPGYHHPMRARPITYSDPLFYMPKYGRFFAKNNSSVYMIFLHPTIMQEVHVIRIKNKTTQILSATENFRSISRLARNATIQARRLDIDQKNKKVIIVFKRKLLSNKDIAADPESTAFDIVFARFRI